MQVISTSDTSPEPMIPTRPRLQAVESDFTQSYGTVAAFIHVVDEEIAQFRENGARMYELRRGFYEA